MILPDGSALTFDLGVFDAHVRAAHPDLVSYEMVLPHPCAALEIHARFADGAARTLKISGLTLLAWGAYRAA